MKMKTIVVVDQGRSGETVPTSACVRRIKKKRMVVNPKRVCAVVGCTRKIPKVMDVVSQCGKCTKYHCVAHRIALASDLAGHRCGGLGDSVEEWRAKQTKLNDAAIVYKVEAL